jgi:hypothetical protein
MVLARTNDIKVIDDSSLHPRSFASAAHINDTWLNRGNETYYEVFNAPIKSNEEKMGQFNLPLFKSL